jgi:hypothetical protein
LKRQPNNLPIRWLKFDVWFNSGCVALYTMWLTWLVWQFATGQSPWGWISIGVTIICLLYFAMRARRAFRQYVEEKEKSGEIHRG